MPTQFFGCDYAEIMPGIRGWTQSIHDSSFESEFQYSLNSNQSSSQFAHSELRSVWRRLRRRARSVSAGMICMLCLKVKQYFLE